jgi:hypothetical protein
VGEGGPLIMARPPCSNRQKPPDPFGVPSPTYPLRAVQR